MLVRYNELADKIQMSGPTNFAPVIRKAMSIVKETEQFHVLVIIADGQVPHTQLLHKQFPLEIPV